MADRLDKLHLDLRASYDLTLSTPCVIFKGSQEKVDALVDDLHEAGARTNEQW